MTVARVAASSAGGAVLAFIAWFVLRASSLPAFNTSMVIRGLATAFSMIVLVTVAILMWLWMRGKAPKLLTEVVAALAPPAIVVTSLGIPLSATRLYLDGVQVDQGFRTQFLSRMTETMSNQDMNYFGLPTFYPIGWFWLGGRMANLVNMAGWEVYQPWAIVSLAAAAAALTPIWRALTGSLPAAAAIAIATTAIVLTETADEPYAAIVAMFVPAAAVGAGRALNGSWKATAALAVYLGLSATFYTLFTGITALSVVALAILFYLTRRRSLVPVKHLLVIGTSSILIALIAWGPYLYRRMFGDYQARSTANHFLPVEGTEFALPFFSFSVVGLLSLLGLLFLCTRIRTSEATGLAVAIALSYAWALLSMVTPLVGTSLLGFRVEVLILLLFVTAGVLAFTHADEVFGRIPPAVTTAAVILAASAGLLYVQQIPAENQAHIDQAYADTDGNGERADRFPPDAGRYYGDIREFISAHGYEPADAVVQTDEINFMAMNPYYGFNAFTSHYANPLGEYGLRVDELIAWAEGSYADLADPDAMLDALDSSRWRAPDVFVFRGNLEDPEDPFKTHVGHDIFPNEPNMKYQRLFFNPAAFDSPAWDTEQVGPFVVVVRNR
ncbi:arabinofuranosyltransferase [Corynebacterium qintianiae]|uniref:Galactan 5-O-arabinofuranosyltransferase n=1 Tax=Corynebacterium qintianiae TaxID=2709392 RepID=A0A7T0KMR6_9CORY|nr:arabinofuranosyltransferase [Corynebacterium qintianiae]QPK83339.1 arabinofuranosyltransferase [Corynebacterium qintianiae]